MPRKIAKLLPKRARNGKNASQRITNSFRRMSVSFNRCISRGKHIYTCLVGNGDVLIDSKTIECFRFNEFYCKYEKDTPNVFDTPQCRRLESFLKKFLLAQEFGYLGDLSEVHFKFSHLSWVVNIKELMADFIENIEIENEDLQESIKRFNSVFDKFYKKININKKTYEEFYKGLDDYAYIQGFANLNLRNLYNTGYSSNDVVGIYATIQREEDRYEIYSDSDSDSDIYILPSSDSDSEFETD